MQKKSHFSKIFSKNKNLQNSLGLKWHCGKMKIFMKKQTNILTKLERKKFVQRMKNF